MPLGQRDSTPFQDGLWLVYTSSSPFWVAFLLLTHWRQQAVHRAVCRRDHCGYLFPEDKDAEQHTMSRHCCMKNCPTQNILGQTLTSASQHTPLMVKVLWLEMWTIRANRLLEIDVGVHKWWVGFPLALHLRVYGLVLPLPLCQHTFVKINVTQGGGK